ncbi:MAG: phospholipid/cholesterol/gamma-HCH transport system ATP-binding protein [Francisellaceae bacterium]|jgi:phospholipid/cholesterol/gamma-HCH transport system ATP-binding protein
MIENNESPIIQVKNLGTKFGTDWVHKNLDLDIYSNRIISIIGDSGCGKTTLVREILLLQEITEGEIYLMGNKICDAKGQCKNSKLYASKMGMMFQQGALFSNLTCLENVMFPLLEFTDYSQSTIADIARLKLSLAGLSELAHNKYPSELSGGMLKRTALARTIALDPEIIFLDEPSAGLDPEGAHELDCLIESLQSFLGITVIMITHDLDTIWKIADEIIYLGNKKVLAHDSVINAAKNTEIPGLNRFFNGPRGKLHNTTSKPNQRSNK